jgi:galactofuranose transport system permease protein
MTRPRLSANLIPVAATAAVWVLMIAIASMRYRGFFEPATFINLLRENAHLGIAAVGMTFVILTGGIDLSVGAVVALVNISLASLIMTHGWSPYLAIPTMLAAGLVLGTAMGLTIAFFELPPFLVTLAGMFLARGLAQVVSLENIEVTAPLYGSLSDFTIKVFPVPAIALLAVFAIGTYVAWQTRFGRAVYALGGSESSSLLMGVPVRRTKILVYALSGLCAATAGVVFNLGSLAGDSKIAVGLELDAIASVVIGGTPLSGGIGYVPGTLLGVLIYGTIQTIINFEGLNSWWTRIAIGVLLLAFILLQKLVQGRGAKK